MTQQQRPPQIGKNQLSLLQEVLTKRAPDMVARVVPKARANTLDKAERLWLCELIGAEFAETGVDEELEPLPRGVRLEELLDAINRPNLTSSPDGAESG